MAGVPWRNVAQFDPLASEIHLRHGGFPWGADNNVLTLSQ